MLNTILKRIARTKDLSRLRARSERTIKADKWTQEDEAKHPRDHGKFSSKPGTDGDAESDNRDRKEGSTEDIIEPDEQVEIYDHSSGEVLWSGTKAEADDLLREQKETGDTLEGLEVQRAGTAAQKKDKEPTAEQKAEEKPTHTPAGISIPDDPDDNQPGGKKWVDPPEKLYHATYAAEEILNSGFKTADESGIQVLGGSKTDSVSFTTKENAEVYQRGLEIARLAAQGELAFNEKNAGDVALAFGVSRQDLRSLWEDAERRRDDDPKKWHHFLQGVSFRGRVFPLFMGSDWPDAVKNAGGPPGLIEIDSKGPEGYTYNPGETEWRIEDVSKINIVGKVSNNVGKQIKTAYTRILEVKLKHALARIQRRRAEIERKGKWSQADEDKHPRDRGRFASKPGASGSGKDKPGARDASADEVGPVSEQDVDELREEQPTVSEDVEEPESDEAAEEPEADEPEFEWDGTIDAHAVEIERGTDEIAEWDHYDDDGEHYPQEVVLQTGYYDPNPDDPDSEPVEVYRWESRQNGDGTATGDWTTDENEARRDGKQYARENHQDKPEWDGEINQRDVERDHHEDYSRPVANWTDSQGDEHEVVIETGNYSPGRGMEPVEVYRWRSMSDSDGVDASGDWTADRDEARRDGRDHAEQSHQEPEGEFTLEPSDLPAPRKRQVQLGGEPLQRSQAEVKISSGAAKSQHGDPDDFLQAVFGHDDWEDARATLATCIGMPDDAKIEVIHYGGYNSEHNDDSIRGFGVRVNIEHPEILKCTRFIGVDSEGKRFVKNEILLLKDKGSGIGTEIFSRQVEAAASAGIDVIRTHAAGGYGGSMNGYYTWPRFGYDMSLTDPEGVHSSDAKKYAKARQVFPDAKTVLDIMATRSVDLPEDEAAECRRRCAEIDKKLERPTKARETITGADWWLAFGTDMMNAQFDLSEGSRSLKTLSTYTSGKKKKG